MKKNVGLLFYDGWIGVSPTIMSLITYHIQKQDYVKLFIRHDDDHDLSVLEIFDKAFFSAVKITLQQKFFLLDIVSRVLNKLYSLNLFNKLIQSFQKKLFIWQKYSKMCSFSNGLHFDNTRFDYFIVVDSTGLFALKNKNVNTGSLIYLSLELLKLTNISDWLDKKIYNNEKALLREKVNLILIQNLERWNFLKKYHHLKEKKIVFLPNSCFDDYEETNKKGNFFQHNLNLSPHTIIVASAGMIHPWTFSLEIAEATGKITFERPVKVVFHDRMAAVDNEYIAAVKKAGGDNLLISDFPLPYSQISKVFSSIDIGLAIYAPCEDPNVHLIGAASGKLFQYIKHGVPVITNRLPGLAEIIEDNSIGVVINTLDEMGEAINKILTNYTWFSENAKRAFKSKYQMGLFLEEYYKQLQHI